MLYLLLALAVVVPLSAGTEWIELNSPNFHLITTAGSGDARRTIEYFEQVRDFFMRNRSDKKSTRLPVTIVLFRNMKEFKPYAPNEVAAAYYTGDQSHDYIVMSGATEDERPLAVHEYTHLLVRDLDLKLPPWLNEGLADVYSSLTPLAGKLAVGMIPRGRAYSLAIDKWIPMERVLAVEHDSPEYNEKARAGAFYAQSWMLVHMLMLSDAYRENFTKFVTAISGGATAETAFRQIYSRTIPEVSKDLNAYYRGNMLKAALFDMQLQKVGAIQPHPADEFTVELVLARICGLSGRKDESKTRLQRLATQYPQRWEVHEAIGNLAWRARDVQMARESLKRAVDLKPEVWSVYWDYARVAQPEPSEREHVIDAIRRSLQLNGSNLDARFALGYELFQAGRYQEAYETFKVIRSVPPERAPTLFLGLAHSAARLEKFDEAKTAAANASKYAKEARDVESAKQLLEYLDRHDRAEAQRKEWEKAGGAPVPPPQSDAGTPAAPVGQSQILSSVRGLLKQVDCLSGSARLRVEAGEKILSLLIANPESVTIRNEPGSSVSLTCGPQTSAVQVAIEYVDSIDPRMQTTGQVRAVEFLNTGKRP